MRRGFDAELSALIRLPGLFLVGETPVGNWIRPVVRMSLIDNLFDAPVTYPALSVDWDWRKYDFGLRLGLLRDVDLTVEFSRHDMIVPTVGTLHPDEFLVTLRVGSGLAVKRLHQVGLSSGLGSPTDASAPIAPLRAISIAADASTAGENRNPCAERAPEVRQQRHLLLCLDAFRHHVEPQAVGEADHRAARC